MLRTSLFALICSLLLAVLPASQASADALSDLGKYSVFSQSDYNDAANGKIVTARGPSLNFPRDLSVQALYVLRAPVPKALAMHQQWDAGRHSELKVYLHHDFSTHPSAADFSQSLPGNGAVRKLIAATQKLPDTGDLQLSKAEAESFKAAGSVQSFWSQVLFHRATAFLQRGLSGEPPYDTSAGSARVSDEVSRLLREQPKVHAAFRPIIGASALGGGGAGSVLPYWELFDVEDTAAFSLGATSAIQNGDSAQMADFQYYASGGYFTFITLYQMWPITVDGKSATLVWRVDCLSSLSLADLRPFERMGSGAAMMQDVRRIITFFERDMGR